MSRDLFILIPLIGYAGLWILASPVFLLYFKLFHVAMDLKHALAMIQQVPSVLSIATVPICSFVSFFATTKVTLYVLHTRLTTGQLLQIGVVSLVTTIVLDVLVTVLGEKIDIRKFPLSLMYFFAYLVIIPAVVLGR